MLAVHGDGDGSLALFIGNGLGRFTVYGDNSACYRYRDAVPVLVEVSLAEGEADLAGLFILSHVLKVGVLIGKFFGIGENIRRYIVVVLDRVGKAPRRYVVDIVAVAVAVSGTPETSERKAVLGHLGLIACGGSALIKLIMSGIQSVVDGKRTVGVDIGDLYLFASQSELAVLVGDGDEHLCAGILSGYEQDAHAQNDQYS